MKTIPLPGLTELPKSVAFSNFARCCLFFLACSMPGAMAQPTAGATITGRVANDTNGQYLRNAKVSIEGTAIETFTDELGNYTLANVPGGQATVRVFYTGLEPETLTLNVPASGTLQQDFGLRRIDTGDGVVELKPFTVAENREYNARAIALNEQRFAPNLKNVVSADEFGELSGEGNLGEFIKFIPGVSVGYSVGVMATGISIRGFPSLTTMVTMDGGELATAGAGNPNRQLDLWAVPVMSNVARVEVSKTPTPDMPANMLGGAVNLKSRSAFEFKNPQFKYSAAGTWHSKTEGLRYPGTRGGEDFTIGPSADFSYTRPVNDRFGFSVNGSYFTRLNINQNAESSWDLNSFHLETFEATRSPQWRTSITGGGGFDLKVGRRGVLSGKLSYSESDVQADRYGLIATHRGGIGDETSSQSIGNRGRLTLQSRNDTIHTQTWTGSLNFRQDTELWKFEGNLSYSSGTSKSRALQDGAFRFVEAQYFNVFLRMDGIGPAGPRSITSVDGSGNVVDVTNADSYNLVSGRDYVRNNLAISSGGRFDVTRHLDFAVPVDVKTGVYYRKREKDYKGNEPRYTFLGPDLRANNADNRVGLYDLINHNQSALPGPFGTVSASYIDPYKATALYRAHPDQWTTDPTQIYTDRVNNSKLIEEEESSAYIRSDVRLLSNRLWVVGGVRFERTETSGAGPLNDISATFRKDARGDLLLDANGRAIPLTTDPYELAVLQYKERGARADRSYDGYYPNLNLTYNLTENLIARAAYSKTIGRPQFNTIVPGISISSPEAVDRIITVSNTGLLPWEADGYDLSLEWYFARNSLLSTGVFRKDAKDFHGTLITPATPELLAQHGLTDDYLDYEFRSTTNVGDAQITGYEFAYRQSLTFLPHWARGIQVFANATFLELEGSTIADFSGYAERDLSWGVALSRSRYSVKLNWSSNGEVRGARIVGDVYYLTPNRTTVDASFEYRLSPKFALYGTARNLLDRRDARWRAGGSIPDYARYNRYNEPGIFAVVGIKGEF